MSQGNEKSLYVAYTIDSKALIAQFHVYSVFVLQSDPRCPSLVACPRDHAAMLRWWRVSGRLIVSHGLHFAPMTGAFRRQLCLTLCQRLLTIDIARKQTLRLMLSLHFEPRHIRYSTQNFIHCGLQQSRTWEIFICPRQVCQHNVTTRGFTVHGLLRYPEYIMMILCFVCMAKSKRFRKQYISICWSSDVKSRIKVTFTYSKFCQNVSYFYLVGYIDRSNFNVRFF